jgi:CDP-diacylglycerol--glycerol-3-phosphate 3-phosphatidyltransferase
MRIKIGKEGIPWAMAASRAMLGPVLIVGERCNWSGLMLAWLVVTALVSDIFDGVLARRWRCDTAGVRLFDSLADTVFYVCVAVALWIGLPQVWRGNGGLLAVLLAPEAVNFGVALAKFGKQASYHSHLAKTWGLVMATGVIATFASGRPNVLIAIALTIGVACNLEGIAMSLMLPVWHKDVKTLHAAWQLRKDLVGLPRAVRHSFSSWQREKTVFWRAL